MGEAVTISRSEARASVLGCPIDRLDMQQTLARCQHYIDTGGFAQHIAINAAKLVAMRDSEELREVARRCEIVSADGQSIVWASRLLGDPLPCRVAGIDLMRRLIELAAENGYRVYILGATQEILERAVERLRDEHPGVNIVGCRNGYFSEEASEAVAAEIRSARPQILFVAMSSPRKEYFLSRYGRAVGAPLIMGVGGAIDVVAGVTRRAPMPLQKLGLEWLYRLLQEPRRLAGRYLRTNARFLALLVCEAVVRRLGCAGAARR